MARAKTSSARTVYDRQQLLADVALVALLIGWPLLGWRAPRFLLEPLFAPLDPFVQALYAAMVKRPDARLVVAGGWAVLLGIWGWLVWRGRTRASWHEGRFAVWAGRRALLVQGVVGLAWVSVLVASMTGAVGGRTLFLAVVAFPLALVGAALAGVSRRQWADGLALIALAALNEVACMVLVALGLPRG